MLKVINCKDLFSLDFVEEIKEDIKSYHQGFMIVGDELYIPYYTALRIDLDMKDAEVTVLDNYDNVTARDVVSHEFGRSGLDELTIIDLAEAVYNQDLSQAIDIVGDTIEEAWHKGYDSCYDYDNCME